MENGTLYYKGYKGSAKYSIEDGVWFGKILNITDLVNYEAETKDLLQDSFNEAVDDYIEICKSI